MQNTSQKVYSSLLWTIFGALGLGWLFDIPGWGLALGLLVWSIRQLQQMHRLQHWVLHESDREPPEGDGQWGLIFDGLARLRKKTRRREKDSRAVITRFQQSSAALQDAVVIIDKQQNMEWWNRSADRLLGLKKSSDLGKPVINMLRDPRFIRYFRKGNYEDPLQLASPVDNDITLQYHITHFGQADRLLVARDVTRLMRLEQTRQDFVANASHELRTPLTVIRGYLETFLDLPETNKPMKRALEQMQQQSQRMESLVGDLLLLSRLEAGQHTAEERPVKLHAMVENIVEAAEVLGNHQHTFNTELDSANDLLGHERELHSAFSNLIYNAVRYTQPGGTITIRWWRDEEGAYLAVQDNGIGIESVHLDRLTERFYRVDEGRSSSTGGTGLGLAIVKHVLARHGAHLEIESRYGHGSCFTCHFPADMFQPIRQPQAEVID